jgi:cobalt-zinc-cadmium efflux system membrane fusion protein
MNMTNPVPVRPREAAVTTHGLPALLLAALLALAGCRDAGSHDHDHGAEHADEHADAHGDHHGGGHDDHHEAAEPTRGEHGGRLLEDGDLAVELAIAETGVPPHYQAWLYRGGKPVAGSEGAVEVHLRRLGNVAERHVLRPQADGSLVASTVVGEPHSFDVEVRARIGTQTLRWAYPSHEGRTRIDPRVAQASGIRVARAGPGTIADEHVVQGLLTPVEGRVALVAARFPGPIRRLAVNVGDRVVAGQPLATIESNLSLTEYVVPAPIAGVVMARHAVVGASAAEGAPLFELADLSSIAVDLHLFGPDVQRIGPGSAVRVTRLGDAVSADATVDRVLPGAATASQSTVARASFANADGLWRPGAAVSARIVVQQKPAALVVPRAALQTFRDWDVVFVRVGDTYEIRPLTLGARDARNVEVLEGLAPGAEIVVEQSFLVKADIEKSGASHDH